MAAECYGCLFGRCQTHHLLTVAVPDFKHRGPQCSSQPGEDADDLLDNLLDALVD